MRILVYPGGANNPKLLDNLIPEAQRYVTVRSDSYHGHASPLRNVSTVPVKAGSSPGTLVSFMVPPDSTCSIKL